jgi:hypothetical protein
MVFNDTSNNISVISWRSVLLVEETGVPVENHRPVASHWQTLSHNIVHLAPSSNFFLAYIDPSQWHIFTYKINITILQGAVVVIIVWYMDLQLSMQSVLITTDVVGSNLDLGEVYNIMW